MHGHILIYFLICYLSFSFYLSRCPQRKKCYQKVTVRSKSFSDLYSVNTRHYNDENIGRGMFAPAMKGKLKLAWKLAGFNLENAPQATESIIGVVLLIFNQ